MTWWIVWQAENCSQTCKNLFRFRVIVSDGNKSLKAVAAGAAAGLKIPTGTGPVLSVTGPVLPVTGQTGPDPFRFRPVAQIQNLNSNSKK